MEVYSRTINTGEIGSKRYFEGLDIILDVFIHSGFSEVIKENETPTETLVVYGYKEMNKGVRTIVKQLYKY